MDCLYCGMQRCATLLRTFNANSGDANKLSRAAFFCGGSNKSSNEAKRGSLEFLLVSREDSVSKAILTSANRKET